jgi:type IV pilus assembly protein PilY1
VDDSESKKAAGMETLRNALLNTFTEANVPDGSIRLAWQAMTGCADIPSGGDCRNENTMRVLDAAHRKRFTDWVATLRTQGATPSHRMLINAGEYYKKTRLGIDSPWASVPGTTEAPLLGCRKAYDIFMTDGGWNSWTDNAWPFIGNADGTTRTLPDGTVYDASSTNAYPFKDSYGSAALPTLADVAFYYWADDLQPGIANNVPKRMVVDVPEIITSGGTTRAVPPYWNPRNDPATWQHMITYTVGFNAAANWNRSTQPKFGTDTWTGGDYPALMTGTMGWTDAIEGNETTRMPELWHMALNSRGKFVPAPNANALTTAFQDILNTINADQSTPVTSVAGNSLTTRTASMAFAAGYQGANWTGYVTAYGVAAGTGALSSTGAWGTIAGSAPPKPVTTASKMDASTFDPAARVVLSHDGTQGIAWKWSALSADQKTALNTLRGTTDARGSDRLDYLRGDRSKEVSHGGSFRNRASRQGDIVNSRLWYLAGKPAAGFADSTYAAFRSANASRASMLYVGGNDGMLHGFSAAEGVEKIAYVPRGLHAALPALTDVNYAHRYYVDGSPLSGDLKVGAAWKTYLAGFLGAGGRGYFVLDVTAPDSFGSASPNSLVVIDDTDAASLDPDVGHIFSDPVMDDATPSITRQITKLNDGRWALVMGNGYNSPNEQAALLIQYLDGAKELLKLTAGAPGGNGLGAPRLVDLNGDKVPDVAYAGDLQGKLWKFDLSGSTSSTWNVAFGGTPLYVAKDAGNNPQPITAAPVWLPHPNGGTMVVFGTGRNLTDADQSSTAVQSVYGIHDNTSISRNATNELSFSGGAALTGGRSELVGQSVDPAVAGTAASGARMWSLSSNAVDYVGAGAKKGWYLDLPDSGERVVSNLSWFAGQLIDVNSTVPNIGSDTAEETCSPSLMVGHDFLNTMNALTGAAPRSQVYAYAASGALSAEMNASRSESGKQYRLSSSGGQQYVCLEGKCTGETRWTYQGLQPSWRQLQ